MCFFLLEIASSPSTTIRTNLTLLSSLLVRKHCVLPMEACQRNEHGAQRRHKDGKAGQDGPGQSIAVDSARTDLSPSTTSSFLRTRGSSSFLASPALARFAVDSSAARAIVAFGRRRVERYLSLYCALAIARSSQCCGARGLDPGIPGEGDLPGKKKG